MAIEPTLHRLNIYSDDLSENEIISKRLGDGPYFGAFDDHFVNEHLFTETKGYEVCDGTLHRTFDLTVIVPKLGGHPHRVMIENADRWTAYDWAVENIAAGFTVQHPDSPGVQIDDWSRFEWLKFETAGMGLALTAPGHVGKWFSDPLEVFFFKTQAKAALFRTFVG